MPAVVEADDGQLYVMKFVGAGQGRKALIAEWIAGEIGRMLGLRVPEMVFINLDPALGPSEPDPEIHDLLRFSIGLNLGLQYLPQAFTFNPVLPPAPSSALASAIVWFDAYVTNVDRTPRNVNILVWQDDLWLIDHGACLYFHHTWKDYMDKSRTPFPAIKDHVLLPFAGDLDGADASAHARLSADGIRAIVDRVPHVWLAGDESIFPGPAEHRQAYVDFLLARLEASQVFTQEAKNARAQRV